MRARFQPPEFDLIFSRFGVMFFADPWWVSRVATPCITARRLAFVCWRAMQENEWAAAPSPPARSLLPPQEPRSARRAVRLRRCGAGYSHPADAVDQRRRRRKARQRHAHGQTVLDDRRGSPQYRPTGASDGGLDEQKRGKIRAAWRRYRKFESKDGLQKPPADLPAGPGRPGSHVQRGVQRVVLDEFAARLDHIAHQLGEQIVGLVGVLDLHLQQRARVLVQRGFPQLLGFISPRPL